MGIEPTQSAWKAEVLPLNYTRIVFRCIGHPLAAHLAACGARKVGRGRKFALSPPLLSSGGNAVFGGGGKFHASGVPPFGLPRHSRRSCRFALASNLLSVRLLPARARRQILLLVEGGGFEPPKAEPSDLQSDPFDRSGTPPKKRRYSVGRRHYCQLRPGRRSSGREKHCQACGSIAPFASTTPRTASDYNGLRLPQRQ